jgi:hypothetical protein
VDDQRLHFPAPAHAELLGHFIGHGKAHDEVAQVLDLAFFRICREAEDIGGLVDAAMIPVQFAHGPVVEVGDGYAVGIGGQPVAQFYQQLAEGSLTGTPEFAAAGPVDLKGLGIVVHLILVLKKPAQLA